MSVHRMWVLVFLLLGAVAHAQGLPIIKNHIPTKDSITLEEVAEIYLLRVKTWPDGTPIVVVHFPLNHPVHQAFLKQYVGLGAASYARRVNTAISMGKSTPLITVKDMADMLTVLRTTEGAIGYGDSTYYYAPHEDDVVEIRVD